ncbi:unnamed protein product [Rotaria sp. Silwood1]|nr:unnamed protein product [Rotaria sp. Silwood1]CAF3334719.1 unnamed protein product [Rotaria sp. Silwood1]CAF3347118.1 unnamed protein product [Rotaria sp. Silwood1]CAF3360223.1 unnamed protein product [Rotaria sp. Silwood1]CAF4485648.1 unnamed protein product [Rotaria sp. Silwood1]
MQILIIYFLVFLCFTPCLLSISISPCAKWNTTGLTIAGNGVQGIGANQLNYPQGIFIHDKIKRLYVSDTMNNRIQVFPLDRSTQTGLTVVSSVKTYYKIYVDDDNDDFPTIYAADNSDNRVEKWTKGATNGVQVGSRCLSCTGVWLDKDKNIYMSDHDRHCILKWSPLTNITTTVAGELGVNGPSANQLNQPQGIFVDKTTSALYIADLLNHRVQKWPKNALEGVTVAGSSDGNAGSDNASLHRPYGLRVDEETKIVYVVDLMNNRIQRWKHGETEGDTIVGGYGEGNENNQFHHPTDLAFDDDGNLYVSDAWNHRVQFFALIDNRPCQATLTTTVKTSTGLVNSSMYKSPIALAIVFSITWIIMQLL